MKALILFHGYTTDKSDLFPVYEYYKNKYDLVVSENFPGHDENNKNLNGFNCIDTIVKAQTICEQVFAKYEVVDIVGYSMGGAIATAMTVDYNFNKIILLAPANKYLNSFTGISHMRFIYRFCILIRHRKFKKIFLSDIKTSLGMIPSGFKKVTHKSVFNFMMIIKYCNDKLKSSNDKIASVSIIWGKLDSLVPHSSLVFLGKYFSNTTIYELEGVSHMLLKSEFHDEVLSIIIKELGEVK